MRTRAISSRSSSSSTRLTSLHDALAGGAGRRHRGGAGRGRWLAARAQHDGLLAVAAGQPEPQVVEQGRLAEPLEQALEQLRPQHVELVHPRARRDLDPQQAIRDPVGASALRDLGPTSSLHSVSTRLARIWS